MASILNVDQIGHSTSGTTAITIASDGTVTMPENDSGWIEITLNSPFTAFTVSTDFGNPEYRKIGNIVNIQGLVNANSASNASTIFTLPVGYRPKKRLIFTMENGNNVQARVDIHSNGNVEAHAIANNGTWLNVNMTFMVA
jgi:hypothetical protein